MSIESVFKEMIAKEVRSQANVELNDLRQQLKSANSKLDAYAAGLQAVYDQVRTALGSDLLDSLHTLAAKNANALKAMESRITEIEGFNRDAHKKVALMNDLYTLARANDYLVAKLARVIRAVDE